MPLTWKMVASEVLMCGLKKAPVAGTAFEVVDALRASHAKTVVNDRLADLEDQMTRWEKRQRDLVAEEIQTILGNLSRPGMDGASLTEEIRNLRQIQEQGWNPRLFEGLMLNSTHLAELKRNPHHYGRILDDRDPVNPAQGIHILLDADKTRVLELTPFAFSQLLANQASGVPGARMQLGDGVWALPDGKRDVRAQAVIDKFQWMTAGTVFTNPVPALDLMATGAVQYQMISEIAAVYGVEITTSHVKMIGTQMIQMLLKTGLVKATTSLIAGLFKSSLVGYAAGGAVQAVSMAYLTHVSGHAFADYFRHGQSWGDGGMGAALIRQFDLNSRAEFLQEFAQQALGRLTSKVFQKAEAPAGGKP